MASDIRTSQLVTEILQTLTNPEIRSSQLVTEILQTLSNPEIRSSQVVTEIIYAQPVPPPLARGKLGPRIQSM